MTDGSLAPRPYHHGGLRAALIEAGLVLLEEEGLEGLTLRAIAARAGVSHAAPRRHFPSLRALHVAIAAEGFRRHAAAMRAGLREGASREERLWAALRGYAAFAEAHPALYALMFSPLLQAGAEDPEIREAGAASYAVLSDVAAGLEWPGAEGPDRQRRSESMLWSLIHGFATLRGARLLGGPDCMGPPLEGVMPRFGHAPDGEGG